MLDIREADEFAAWHIHGSSNLPVYNALRIQNDRALVDASGKLPKDRRIVAVCRAGIMSQRAALILESLGFEAASLVGGIRGWGGVWSEAELPRRADLPKGADLFARQVRRNGKGCLSYVLASGSHGLVVDPCVEVEAYLEIAQRHDVTIEHVLETHVHADHISRARALCEATGASLKMAPNSRVNFPYDPLPDGASLQVGQMEVQAIATAGHTGESTCYKIDDRFLLTGDTLFVERVGRPDLERGDAGAADGAKALYHSLNQILSKLDPGLWVGPAHTGEPIVFDGAAIGGWLGSIYENLELMRLPEDEFIKQILGSLQPKPPNHETVIGLNEGKLQIAADAMLDLEAGPNRCAAG